MILHIVLLIFKILGFLILGILALILLLALVLVFSPVVYRVQVSGKNTLESLTGSVRFRWLFRLISGEARYENGDLTWRFRAAWKHFENGDGGNSDSYDDTAGINTGKTVDTEENENISKSSDAGTSENTGKTADIRKTENIDTAADVKVTAAVGRAADTKKTKNIDNTADAQTEKDRSGISKKITSVYERIQKFQEKIKYTFQNICDKIRTLKQKKDALADFIRDEIHQNAFRRGIREIKRLLYFLKPDHADIEIEFGFSDPAYTGYTLAAVSIFWPLIGEYTRIQPDFEHRILRGEADVKGKIRAVYALIFAWNLVWDKNVRTTFKHVRKFIK